MFKELQDKFNHLLWHTDLSNISQFQVFLIQTLRIFYGAFRDLSGGLLSLRAMGLVYTTLLSIVPLLAVSFSLLKGFGAHNQLEPALLSLLEPLGEKGVQISQQIISFVDNIKVGVLGSLSLVILIFTVLSLVKKIESAFNFTWRIKVTRNIMQRFSNYLSVILVGPLLLFTAAGLTASLNSSSVINRIISIEPFGTILLIAGGLAPYVLTIITFTLVYKLIPNTKVQFKSAVYGAVVATIMWKMMGTLFTAFIADSTNYTAIYSTFAIMIVFMIWIYVNWLIVLTGASICYFHQYPERSNKQLRITRLSCRLREKLALTVMQLIADSFQHNQPTWTIKTLAKRTGISEQSLGIIITALLNSELISTTGEDKQHFLPSQSLENISLDMIINAARCAEESSLFNPDDINSVQQVDDALRSVENSITDSVKHITLKDLI